MYQWLQNLFSQERKMDSTKPKGFKLDLETDDDLDNFEFLIKGASRLIKDKTGYDFGTLNNEERHKVFHKALNDVKKIVGKREKYAHAYDLILLLLWEALQRSTDDSEKIQALKLAADLIEDKDNIINPKVRMLIQTSLDPRSVYLHILECNNKIDQMVGEIVAVIKTKKEIHGQYVNLVLRLLTQVTERDFFNGHLVLTKNFDVGFIEKSNDDTKEFIACIQVNTIPNSEVILSIAFGEEMSPLLKKIARQTIHELVDNLVLILKSQSTDFKKLPDE